MNGVGWGLIGASTIAREWVIDAIRQAGGHIACAMSSDEARARDFSRDNGIPASTTSLDKVLAEPGVEAVYISTTNELHRGQTLAAAAAGKHVLCEKPLALTLADAREMVDACKRANVVMATNHHLRNAGTHIAMREAIRAGAIGRPLAARVFHAVSSCRRICKAGASRTPRRAAASCSTSRCTTPIRCASCLATNRSRPSRNCRSPAWRRQALADGVMAILRFRSGLVAQLHDGFTTRYAGTGFEVHGTEGSLIGRDVMTQHAVGSVTLGMPKASGSCRPTPSISMSAACGISMPRSAAKASLPPPARTAYAPSRRRSPSSRRHARDGAFPSPARRPDHGIPVDRLRRGGGAARSRRRGRHRLVIERARLPGSRARGDRPPLRGNERPREPHDAASDRGGRHVGDQGDRPYRQARPARRILARILSERSFVGRAAGDLADDRGGRDPGLQHSLWDPVRHAPRGRGETARSAHQGRARHLRRSRPRRAAP